MARGVVFACASALANAFSRYDNISERELTFMSALNTFKTGKRLKTFYEMKVAFHNQEKFKEEYNLSELALTYIVNPLDNFFKSVDRSLTVVLYARAAAELSRMGKHEEAKQLLAEKLKLEMETK